MTHQTDFDYPLTHTVAADTGFFLIWPTADDISDCDRVPVVAWGIDSQGAVTPITLGTYGTAQARGMDQLNEPAILLPRNVYATAQVFADPHVVPAWEWLKDKRNKQPPCEYCGGEGCCACDD